MIGENRSSIQNFYACNSNQSQKICAFNSASSEKYEDTIRTRSDKYVHTIRLSINIALFFNTQFRCNHKNTN